MTLLANSEGCNCAKKRSAVFLISHTFLCNPRVWFAEKITNKYMEN